MISRSSIPKQISKGGKMPKGPGTYGSKIGRPPKKKLYKKGGPVPGRPAGRFTGQPEEARSKKKKDVNVPGESQRALEGSINHMISKVESEFKKWKKSRRPHKNV